MPNPTTEDRKYWAKLADLGCVACRINGVHNPWFSIHHIDGETKPGAHRKVLPLCGRHHQGGTQDDPSVHPWKRRFEARYGRQMELKAMCDDLLSYDS